ncbi:MAG: mannitol dehydrogenase [Oscillospiraceae bacterium]|nr:mannitol dehydrogenase [Oscillospiraceae bacterium]
MKKAVMYGAGNIGRGFIGQVLHDSGYEVVFIDVNMDIVNALNSKRQYTQLIVSENGTKEVIIDNVRAVDGRIAEAVVDEIATCEFMATSLGANVLRFVAGNIAEGIKKRAAAGAPPLNILICENLMDAAKYLRGLLEPHFSGSEIDLLNNTGLVETVIGRMVPALTPEMQAGDITKIAVEPFCELPVNKDGFKGEIPYVKYMIPFSPFAFYEERKLYIHNMGHAITAYFGYLKGYKYIYEAIADKDIFARAQRAMTATAAAIAKYYNQDVNALNDNVNDLLHRFANKALGDLVVRVGQDPMRKLMPLDRFIGAINRCKSVGAPYGDILNAVAAALKFDCETDKTAPVLQEKIKTTGAAAFLSEYCGLDKDDVKACVEFYETL